MELQKIQIRIAKKGQYSWVHFCYVDLELAKRFEEKVNKGNRVTTDWVKKWAEEDFNLTQLETAQDFEVLKQYIREKYKNLYPEIYIEGNVDRQGWFRVWCTNHIKEELQAYERHKG